MNTYDALRSGEALLLKFAKKIDDLDLLLKVRIRTSRDGAVVAKICIDDDNEKPHIHTGRKDQRTFIFVNESTNEDLAYEKAEELGIEPDDENTVTGSSEYLDYDICTLHTKLARYDNLIIGSIFDLMADGSISYLTAELEYLAGMEIMVFSSTEGHHPAEYFYDVVCVAKELVK